MGRFNPKVDTERDAPRSRNNDRWNNYREPRRDSTSSSRHSVARSSRSYSPDRHDVPRHIPRARERNNIHRHRRNNHNDAHSPRRPVRDLSLMRIRRRANLRARLDNPLPPPRARRVEFQPAVEAIAPNPLLAPLPQRRLSVAHRLAFGNQAENPLVRPVPTRITHVLKFENVPVDVDLEAFLRLLSRTMGSVTGASREYNYDLQHIGPSIFVYAVDQDEIDAAVGRDFSFNLDTGPVIIRPVLLSATITALSTAHVQDPSVTTIPTLLVRNLAPITARHAISLAIDVLQMATDSGANVTHIRIPAHDLRLNRTSSIAFIGVTTSDCVRALDGFEYDRCARKVQFIASSQAPTLIPTGMARRVRDDDWTHLAASSNLLIARPNPFSNH